MKKILLCLNMTILTIDMYPYVKAHVDTVKQKSARKEYINASGCDFRGADMPDLYLANSQLSGANFGKAKKTSSTSGVISIPGQKTNVRDSDFSGSTLISTNFDNALLQKSNFSGAILLNANFSGADLTGAILDDVEFSEYAVFCGATMPDGTKLSGTKIWKNKKGQVFHAHCPKKR